MCALTKTLRGSNGLSFLETVMGEKSAVGTDVTHN